jgi:hypothetical protein
VHKEVEKATKEIRDAKVTGYDDVPGDVAKIDGRRWFHKTVT